MSVREVEFDSCGTRIRADLMLPEGEGPFPVVVMAGGWCYVKELRQPQYAEEFVKRGFAALIFDYRHMGASDGEPRQHIDPWAQVEDYQNAVTWVENQPELDSSRIGAGIDPDDAPLGRGVCLAPGSGCAPTPPAAGTDRSRHRAVPQVVRSTCGGASAPNEDR